jgi:hypothetical protein
MAGCIPAEATRSANKIHCESLMERRQQGDEMKIKGKY